MTLRLLCVALLALPLCMSSASALMPSSYDYMLSSSQNEYPTGYAALGVLEPGEVLKKYFVFDYWYDPDPFPECTSGNPVVPQTLIVGHTPSTAHMGRLECSESSTGWTTAAFETEPWIALDVFFQMPRLKGIDTIETADAGDRLMNNTFYFKDLRSYDSLDGINGNGNNNTDQPVPEPATMAMLGMGVLSFAGFELRRRRGMNA